MNIKKELLNNSLNSVRLKIGSSGNLGITRFGGAPDVPNGFQWECFESESGFDNVVKPRPLTFLAQFDLAEIAKFDTENLLPKTGVLSFFYEMMSMRWGFDPKDKGCARVYWFEDKSALHRAKFPDNLEKDFRLPEFQIAAQSEKSFQSCEDFQIQYPNMEEDWGEFEAAEESLGVEEPDECSKLLGWANPIQGTMLPDCELISRGYYLGHGYDEIAPRDLQEAEQRAKSDWVLLFQLDSVLDCNFNLQFGDSGRIYFYIRREDLAARNFDNVWLFLQCC